MTEQIIIRLNNYFEEQKRIRECNNAALFSDERKDEANFEKIKMNVYDIFYTILTVAEKSCNGDVNKMREFFEDRIERIPLSWSKSLEKAKQFDDAEKMQIEQIKLETVREIKNHTRLIWEDNQ